MVFQSVDKRVFDVILSRLNTNTQDVTFSGNYVFKFSNEQKTMYNFEVVAKDPDYLDFKVTEVVPLVDIQNIELPFVERNERDDMERELYVAIKIERKYDEANILQIEFDDTCAQYQAVLETIASIKDTLTFVEGDYKYSFKTKTPTKVNRFKYNKEWYQIFALTFNLVSIKKGYFGNETKLYFGREDDVSFASTTDYQLDFMEFTPTMGKETRPDSLTTDGEQKVAINRRNWTATIVVNFLGTTADLLLQREVDATVTDNNVKYVLRQVKTNLETDTGEVFGFDRDVFVTSATATYQNNAVDQITFRIERA